MPLMGSIWTGYGWGGKKIPEQENISIESLKTEKVNRDWKKKKYPETVGRL